jgi:alkylated DNA nucleotide flippase Atl1
MGILSVDWKRIMEEQYLVSGGKEGEVRCWRVVEDNGKFKMSLQWSSKHNELLVKDAVLNNAQSLSRENLSLMNQRGARTC